MLCYGIANYWLQTSKRRSSSTKHSLPTIHHSFRTDLPTHFYISIHNKIKNAPHHVAIDGKRVFRNQFFRRILLVVM